MNDQSSRSHYVLRLRIRRQEPDGQTRESDLYLVDLAGSERVKESGVSGEQMAEAKAINKSLSSLGDVIAALASAAKHVPFRNSKLTHLMQNALSGSSKTLMFVNVSPHPRHYHETLSSLRFAQKVNGCLTSNKRGVQGK
jgi:kinesin family protein C1